MGRGNRGKASGAQLSGGANKKIKEEIRLSVGKNLGKLHDEWEPQAAASHNMFLQSVAPEMSQGSQESRKVTSRLGFALEAIANDMAALRYPGDVQSLLLSSSLHANDRRKLKREHPVTLQNIGWKKTMIWSRFNPKMVSEAASELTRYASQISKIGQPGFRKKLLEKFQEIYAAPRSREPWKVEVDLACIHPDIGIVEIKSGGELDKTKAESETKNLIEAYLAYGDMDLPICYAMLYANNGEGRPIKGALKKYFVQDNNLENNGGMLVGSEWWNRILPDMEFPEFFQIFDSEAKQYEIKPYSE